MCFPLRIVLAVINCGAEQDDLRQSGDEAEQLGTKRISPLNECCMGNGSVRRSLCMFPGYRWKARRYFATVDLENRLQYRTRQERPQSIRSQYDDGALYRFNPTGGNTVVGAVRHL